jgi:tripartite-type tricarboxylate transporter receptor subunit TctC
MVTGRVLLAALAVLGFAAPDGADAQSFPEKLIKIVVPYPPGGPSDVAARLVVQPLSAHLGQPVIVENLAGAGGRLGAKAAAGASADGYTLLLGGTNPNAIAPSIYTKLNFEPIKAFTAVGVIGVDSNALVVHPDVPVKTIHELIAYSKANPGSLSSGATVGIGPHVCLELIRSRSGSSMNFIPYKGISQALHGRRRGARSGSRSPAGRC